MQAEAIVEIIRQALMAAFFLAAPLLLIGFIITVVVNIIQIATSLQDSAFSAFPRLVAFFAAAVALLPWMVQRAATYTTALLSSLAKYGQ
jgi:flagellar biosynthetic protein FliQ